MAVLRICLAALAVVQGSKLEVQGPSQDAVTELRAKMETVGDRVKGLYTGKGPLAKTKIVDRLRAWHEEFEKKVQSLDGGLVMQFQRLSEAETSVQDLSKEIEQEKGRLSAETTQQQESLLLGVLMTRKQEPFIDQLKVLISKDFSALPQKDILNYIQAQGDFKTPVVEQVAKYLDAHREQQEASAPNSTQDAPVPQKEVATSNQPSVVEHNSAASNLRKILQKQHEAAEHRKAEAEKQIEVMATAAENHKKESPDLAKKFLHLEHMEQKKLKRELAMEKKQEAALAHATAAVEAGDAAAAHKAQLELQGLLDEQTGKKKKFLVLLDLVGSSKSTDCPYCVGQCMEKCHAGGTPYVACLTACANAKD